MIIYFPFKYKKDLEEIIRCVLWHDSLSKVPPLFAHWKEPPKIESEIYTSYYGACEVKVTITHEHAREVADLFEAFVNGYLFRKYSTEQVNG